MNPSVYKRPNKPMEMFCKRRDRIDDKQPSRGVAPPVMVDKSTECFVTPHHIIEMMVGRAELEPGLNILEPSAGTGAIVNYIKSLDDMAQVACCEMHYQLQKNLQEQGHLILGDNFLEFGIDPRFTFNRIIMNPPFRNGADIKHIKHAIDLLADDGILVAICANGPRQQKELKPLADNWQELPENTFIAAKVQTVLLTIKL